MNEVTVWGPQVCMLCALTSLPGAYQQLLPTTALLQDSCSDMSVGLSIALKGQCVSVFRAFASNSFLACKKTISYLSPLRTDSLCKYLYDLNPSRVVGWLTGN